MSANPPTVPPTDILNALGSSTVSMDASPAIPPTDSATKVQSVVAANSIVVGEFTAKERARAAVTLAYFVLSIISAVILIVFLDYFFHMPATPDNMASGKPVQQASPMPGSPSPNGISSPQSTSPIQQTTFVQEAAFLQATPIPGGATPKTTGTPLQGKAASPEPTPVFSGVAPKTPEENYVFVSNAIADRSSKMFDLIVARALLPVLTALLGYIFGSQPSRSNA